MATAGCHRWCHSLCDDILCDVLKQLGAKELVDEFEKVGKFKIRTYNFKDFS